MSFYGIRYTANFILCRYSCLAIWIIISAFQQHRQCLHCLRKWISREFTWNKNADATWASQSVKALPPLYRSAWSTQSGLHPCGHPKHNQFGLRVFPLTTLDNAWRVNFKRSLSKLKLFLYDLLRSVGPYSVHPTWFDVYLPAMIIPTQLTAFAHSTGTHGAGKTELIITFVNKLRILESQSWIDRVTPMSGKK